MGDLKFKNPPIKQRRTPQRWAYKAELFSESSEYFEALRSTEQLIAKHRQLDQDDWKKLQVLLVHECEMAKQWRGLWENKDDPQRARTEWITRSIESLSAVKKIVGHLRKLDDLQGYDLREVFFKSARVAISPDEPREAWISYPNMNDDGGFKIPTGGPVAQQVESEFAARLFLGQFPDWLQSLEARIAELNRGFQAGAQIGPMILDPPMSDSSLSKQDSTQLAILALVGRLRKIFRLALDRARPLPNYNSIGGDMPNGQVAAWEQISEFIVAAFDFREGELDLPALKQRWSNATKGRTVSFEAWPQPIERQATR